MAKFDHAKLSLLRSSIGHDITILTDPLDPAFIEHAKRWTDVDRKTPAAIILPRSEEEIRTIVCGVYLAWAFSNYDLGSMGGWGSDTFRNQEWRT